jgi:hypothetical protein
MTRKVYRTAQGKAVDLGALQLQNENVRAVGNMGVNARGDLLDQWNRPIDSRNKQVAKSYARQTNVQDTPVTSATNNKPTKDKRAKAPKTVVVDVPPPPEDFEDDFVKPVDIVPVKPEIPEGGLAAAIARSRSIKQEPLQTPKDVARNKPGVSKI